MRFGEQFKDQMQLLVMMFNPKKLLQANSLAHLRSKHYIAINLTQRKNWKPTSTPIPKNPPLPNPTNVPIFK